MLSNVIASKTREWEYEFVFERDNFIEKHFANGVQSLYLDSHVHNFVAHFKEKSEHKHLLYKSILENALKRCHWMHNTKKDENGLLEWKSIAFSPFRINVENPMSDVPFFLDDTVQSDTVIPSPPNNIINFSTKPSK